VNGGVKLAVIGKNFGKKLKVTFRNESWEQEADLDKEHSTNVSKQCN